MAHWLNTEDRDSLAHTVRTVRGITETGVSIPAPAVPSRGRSPKIRHFILLEDVLPYGIPFLGPTNSYYGVRAAKARIASDGVTIEAVPPPNDEEFYLVYLYASNSMGIARHLWEYPYLAKTGYTGLCMRDSLGRWVFITGPKIPPSCSQTTGGIFFAEETTVAGGTNALPCPPNPPPCWGGILVSMSNMATIQYEGPAWLSIGDITGGGLGAQFFNLVGNVPNSPGTYDITLSGTTNEKEPCDITRSGTVVVT